MQIKIINAKIIEEKPHKNRLLLLCETIEQRDQLNHKLRVHMLKSFLDYDSLTITLRLDDEPHPLTFKTNNTGELRSKFLLLINKDVQYVTSAFEDQFGVITEGLLRRLIPYD